MGYGQAGQATAARLADLVEGEERRAGHELVASQPGEQGHVALVEDEAGLLADPNQCAGQVDEPAVAPPGPYGHGHEAPGA